MLRTEEKPLATNRAVVSRRRRRRLSDYGTKLREKQKVKETYEMREGSLQAAFQRFQRLAKHCQAGDVPTSFLAFLERRLDNALCRLGAVASRRAAHQLITHGRVKINGRRVTTPSFWLKAGDQIYLRRVDFSEEVVVPAWLKLDKKKGEATVLRLPGPSEVEPDIDESLVFEYYSRW